MEWGESVEKGKGGECREGNGRRMYRRECGGECKVGSGGRV